MSLMNIPTDLYVQGDARFNQGVAVPANTFGDADIAAARPLGGTKTIARLRRGFSDESATTSATLTRGIHRSRGTGTIVEFVAWAVVANIGAATVTVNLKVDGTTVLSAVIILDSSQIARQIVTGAISTPAYVAGKVFEVTFTATAGGGTLAKGVGCEMVIDENPT